MLVLSRKLNESICIGQDIEVKIVKIRGCVVGLGISAPASVKVMRKELLDREDQNSDSRSKKACSSKEAASKPLSINRQSSKIRSSNEVVAAGEHSGNCKLDTALAPDTMKRSPLGQYTLHVAS